MYIIYDISSLKNPVNLIGNKAYQLLRLKKSKQRVPQGFAISSIAFHHYLQHNNISNADHNDDKKEKILNGVFPNDLEHELLQYYNKINKDVDSLAVRSSSALEDMEGASFAGQYETILHVKRFKDLKRALKECWVSAYSDEVSLYLKNQNIHVDHMPFGVFVQKMINPDAAGVIFSANPITGNKKEILINVNYGLGETVVSGTATPDFYLVSKEGENIQKECGLKEVKMIIAEDKVKTLQTTKEEQESFVISDHMVRQLKEKTIEIEKVYQTPIDIEFAIKKELIYILQVRPITNF